MKLRSAATLLPLVAALGGCAESDANSVERADLYEVVRGDLPITVTEQAEIKPQVSTRIMNEMEGQSTIISLVEEGSMVAKGDRLVELDASSLIDKQTQQGISLHRAGSARLQSEKELDIRRKEVEAETLGGENAVRIAEIDLQKFQGTLGEDGTRDMGEREQALIEAQANIELAKQEVKLAENTLTWSKKLHQKGFITKDELERDELDHQRQLKNLRVAENELRILVKFTHPKESIRLEQAVREATTDLEGIVARGQARIAQAEADLEAKDKEYELEAERTANLEEQIRNSVIYAPSDGLVIYAVQDGRRGREDVVEEGASVRERQLLIELPDVTRMVATLKVHEAVIDKVRSGQRARIKVDAFPDREFAGTVSRVSPVADSGSRWSNNNLKVYKTEVEISGENEVLRPGMTASVTILIASLKDVVFVPLQAIRRQGAVTFVWLDHPDGALARPIDVGLHDFQFVEITDGLTAGDKVFLAKPPGAVEPEFEQPSEVAEAVARSEALALPAESGRGRLPKRGDDRPSAAGSDDGRDERRGRSGRGGGGGGGMNGPAAKALTALLERKYPEFATIAQGDRPFELFRNEDFKQARESDSELGEAWDAMLAEARESFGGGRGERPSGRGAPSGTREGN
ncbi:MAG: efflux RND transporter periplasmic adaptor subunit [Planctomycetota bacterium]